MKKVLVAFMALAIAMTASAVFAMGTSPDKTSASAPTAAYPYLVDNFENGNITENPEWFVFDNIVPTVVRNTRYQDGDQSVLKTTGEYSLNLKGSTSSWYVGGIGCVLGIDASAYRSVEMDIYGSGENSGKVKIELYDDDNGNSEIEVNSAWKPTADDLFLAEVDVNWTGWKHVSLPLSEFKIEGGGNRVWDPNFAGGSGGLVKMQIISVAFTESGDVNYNLDNIELGN
ncbi:MAG: hypothetical protein ABIJ26_01100 [Candidatus Margulisiibacteriota bacterium]